MSYPAQAEKLVNMNWAIDVTLIGTTTLDQSGPGSNRNEGVFHTLQNWSHTIICSLMSCVLVYFLVPFGERERERIKNFFTLSLSKSTDSFILPVFALYFLFFSPKFMLYLWTFGLRYWKHHPTIKTLLSFPLSYTHTHTLVPSSSIFVANLILIIASLLQT